ncbi:MAG: GntR family transcriptional regulator [Peptococcaceae bacterium]|nr:GntR family transcriptional regulator [Peptococcaceae bacterium]
MDFTEDRPIYLQIIEEISRRIARGGLPPGKKMPSVRELAMEMKVNPNTVQRAYHELEREGVIFTRRGQGSFVTEDREAVSRLKDQLASDAAQRFIKEIVALGFKPAEAVDLIRQAVYAEEEGGKR